MELKTADQFKNKTLYHEYLASESPIGIDANLIRNRLQRGWRPERAITTPRIKKPGANHFFKKHYTINPQRRENYARSS